MFSSRRARVARPLPSFVGGSWLTMCCALTCAVSLFGCTPGELASQDAGLAGGGTGGSSASGGSDGVVTADAASEVADAPTPPADVRLDRPDVSDPVVEPALDGGLTDAAQGADLVATGPNQFLNPDFAANLQGWMVLAQLASDSIRQQADNGDGAALVHGDDGVETVRKLQLYQVLKSDGRPYLLAFDVRKLNGVTTRPVQVFCEQAEAPNASYGANSCVMTSVRSTCQVVCTPPAEAMVKFGVEGGQSNLDFFVDNARLNH